MLHDQVPLLDRAAPFMEELVVTKDGVVAVSLRDYVQPTHRVSWYCYSMTFRQIQTVEELWNDFTSTLDQYSSQCNPGQNLFGKEIIALDH